MNSGDKRDAHNLQLALLAVEQRLEGGADVHAMSLGEPFVDGHLVGALALGQPAFPQVQQVEAGLGEIRHRDRAAGGRFGQARHVKKRQVGDARLGGGDAGDGRDAVGDGFRGAPHLGKDIGEAVAQVIRRARFFERMVGAACQHEGGDARRDHQRDGQRLRPHVPQVPHQLAVEHAHGDLPADLGGLFAGRVDLRPGDAPVAEQEHAMRHVLDGGIVGDECGGGAQLPIDLR